MIKRDTRSARKRRHHRVRKRVRGTTVRPRLCVFRSQRHIYAQVISDEAGRTLAAASTLSPELKGRSAGANRAAAKEVGTLVAEMCAARGIRQVVFDRNGYRYHGRIAALAAAARAAGLEF